MDNLKTNIKVRMILKVLFLHLFCVNEVIATIYSLKKQDV